MRLSASCGVCLLFAAPVLAAETGPWDLDALRKAPKVEWVDKDGPLRKLYFESEPVGGKPTRVFAYYAEPEKAAGKLPAMVLVHGGGGTAFGEWAQLWAKRGYAAIAMDLGGRGPDGKRLPDGGPAQDDGSKLPPKKTDLKDVWTYHAVAAVIRAHSLLRELPRVDADRTGITGISWGGYLTCIVAGLDDRFKVAVPVYGCGFIHENSAWLGRFAEMPDDWRKTWVENFDPSRYVGKARMPVLFVNGTNDFAYPLDSYQKTYRLVKDRLLCVKVNMPHSHKDGWAPAEIGLFVDEKLAEGKPLFRFAERGHEVRDEDGAKVVHLPVTQKFDGTAVSKVQLHWTTDTKSPWAKRKWQSTDVPVMPGGATDFYRAVLPKDRPLVWFLTATDERKATVSTEHVILDR
jgi:dienelactone hydrolase